jgi:hypothetical protein
VSNPGMWLEIRRGKTNFPLRPISGDRFLIGAGSHCHLQLGGEHVPMLHSLLVIEGKTAHLEALVSEPPLRVNGEARRSVELHDEDTVEIGDFEFVFHRLVATEPSGQVAMASSSDTEDASGVADLSQLSAVELVGLIEEEARQIAVFNRSRELGAASLLDAARRAGADSHPASVPMMAYPPQTTVEVIEDREAECFRRAAELRQAQEQLASQMAEFATLVARWQESETRRLLRASA